MTAPKTALGGKRFGAGRKCHGRTKKRVISITVSEPQLNWIDTRSKQARFKDSGRSGVIQALVEERI